VYHYSRDYAALDWHPLRTRMPPLDPFLAEVIGDPRLSLSGLMREQMQRLPLDISLEYRSSIHAWLFKLLREIQRVTCALDACRPF